MATVSEKKLKVAVRALSEKIAAALGVESFSKGLGFDTGGNRLE